MGFSCGDDFGSKQKRVLLVDEQRGRTFMDDGVEFELEFGPVEHPMEPQDEDRPIKCPMRTSSVINESRMQEERLGKGLGKRGEVAAEMNKEGNEGGAVRAVRKRHHSLTHEEQMIKPLMRMPPLPPKKSPFSKCFVSFTSLSLSLETGNIYNQQNANAIRGCTFKNVHI